MKKRDKIITIVVLVLFVVFLVYRHVSAPPASNQEVVQVGDEVELREVTVENSYEAPGITKTVSYTLFIDDEGVIYNITSKSIGNPSHQSNMDEFTEELLPRIQGKKIQDLEEIDMVGTSSLTTESFNSALPELRQKADV